MDGHLWTSSELSYSLCFGHTHMYVHQVRLLADVNKSNFNQMRKCYCSDEEMLLQLPPKGNCTRKCPLPTGDRGQEDFVTMQIFSCWWFLQGVPKDCSLIHIICSSDEEVQALLANHVLCWGCFTPADHLAKGLCCFPSMIQDCSEVGNREQRLNFLLQYMLPQRKDSGWVSLDPQFSPCCNTTTHLLQSESQLFMAFFFFLISFFPLGMFLVTEIFQPHLTVTQIE